MPTVVLHGGLGNQLFQYAVGRTLSLKTGSTLYLNVSKLSEPTKPGVTRRKYQLSNYNICGEIQTGSIDKSFLVRLRSKIFDMLRSFDGYHASLISRFHRENRPHVFYPYVLNIYGSSILFGYYQSEKYFSDIKRDIRQELRVLDEPSGENRTWKTTIEETNSASVHVRRGDYVHHGWALPPSYYRSAIAELNSSENDLTLFFFSDDLPWLRRHLRTLLPTGFSSHNVHIVDCNTGAEAHEDLRLMRSCRHNVIANSTFSWWGAWLNQYSDKEVIAPSYWLRDWVKDLDIIPERWTTIDR